MLRVQKKCQVASCVIEIGEPNELVLRHEILTHLGPLCVELKAIIVDKVADRDVLIPSGWIAYLTVEIVLSFTVDQLCLLEGCRACNHWWIVPFDLTEKVLGLVDVDVGWNIVGGRLSGGSDRHGERRQLAYQFNVKTDDGRFVIYGIGF